MSDYYDEKRHLLRAIQLLAAATEELCGETMDPDLASFWAAGALRQIIRMIPEDDRTQAETELLAALAKYEDDPSTEDMIDKKA